MTEPALGSRKARAVLEINDMDSNGFSRESIVRLRSEAHATIRHHAAQIFSLSTVISDVDAAMRLAIAERSIDESQAPVDAARRLAAMLESGGQR